MDKGRQPVSTSPSPEQVPVMIEASAPSTCLGRDGHFNRDTGTTRGDPPTQAGSDIFPQQPQQEHQAQPVVNCKAQQHDKRTILSVIDEDEAGEENSSGNGAGVDGSSTRKEKGEDRNEMDWPPTTKKFSPSAETAPAAVVMAVNTRAALVDHDHNRASNMPVLSAGPHFPYKPERSTGGPLTSLFRLNKPKHQEQQGPQRRPRRHRQSNKMDSLTPRKGGCGTYTTPPNSRPRIHKMPSMFGMLQDAHDQAAPSCVATCTLSSNSHCGSGGSIIEEPGGDESSAAAGIVDGGVTAGNVTAGHKCTSRWMGLVGLGGGKDASLRNATPVPAVVAVKKVGERPPLTSLSINQPPTVDHEEAPRLIGATRRLRENSVRFIQRLPGPRLLMQVLEEEIDPKNVRLTTQSEPIILMEVMPAALVISLLVLTYLVFACGVFLIVWFHLRGTTTLAMGPGSGEGGGELCAWGSSSVVTITTSGGETEVFIIGADGPDPHSSSAAGCIVFSPGLSELSLDSPLQSASSSIPSSLTDAKERYGAVFFGQFSGMTDLSGSVSLHVSFADTEVQESLPDPVAVDIALEACVAGVTAAVGESSSQAELEWGTCEGGWQPVLFQENISARVRSLPQNRGYTLFNFHQNQDTIRGQAVVRQYRVQVGFVSTTTSSSSTGDSGGSAGGSFSCVREARWSLEYETGATTERAKIVLAVVLWFWVPVWLAWCWAVFYKAAEEGFKNALHERKWLALIGLSVVFYLNPIKVVGNFVAPGSASWGLASEMSLSVAEVTLLVVTLCIADGVGRDRVGGGSLGFYVPKVVFGVWTMACMLLVDLASFPTVTGIDRGSLLAVQNWPESQQQAYAWVASARIFMVMLWAVWMLCRMCISGCLLRKLPYVPNRYQQLSYRFFGLQAILLGIVYTMFTLWRLIDILDDDLGGNTFAAQLMLLVRTRQDHLGSVSILCAYALQLFLLFLPSSFKESKLFRNIAVRFVYFEEQLSIAGRKSRDDGVDGTAGGGQARAKVPTFQGGALDPGEHSITSPGDVGKEDEHEKPVFCVETAAWLLELAWEAYADPLGFKNPHNYHIRVQRLARMGFELVRHIHNVEHDTNCFIVKDVPRGRLVVMFRGSVGTKHWMDNLRLFQTEFNLDHMMPTGREHEATKVVDEDIDIQAAKSLHGVVAHMASAREEKFRQEEEEYGDVFEGREEPTEKAQVARSPALAACASGAPPSSQQPSSHVTAPPPVANALSSSYSPVDGRERSTANKGGRGEPGNGISLEISAGAQSGADGNKNNLSDSNNGGRRSRTGGVQGGDGGNDAGGGGSQQQQLHPISQSEIRAILKEFSAQRRQFREQPRGGNRWDFVDHAKGATGTERAGSEPTAAGVASSVGGTMSEATRDHDQAGAAAAAAAEGRDGVGVAPSKERGVSSAPPPPFPSPSPAVPRLRGFPRSGLIASAGNLGPPRLVGSNSLPLVSDIKQGKRKWLRRGNSTGTAASVEGGVGRRGGRINGAGTLSRPAARFEGGIELLGRGGGGGEAQGGRGRSVHSLWGRSASFDNAAILEAGDGEQAARSRNGEGRRGGHLSRQMEGSGSRLTSGGGSWRGLPGESPGAMEGPSPEFVGRTDLLVRGRRTLFDMLREATRWGMEAVDKAAHAMGINRIPFLRQCLWGQVHTGFWDAYEGVRGELHACIRETVIDWILSQDSPPDITIYVTGHSMGGALATHCAMDLKLYTVDKIQARLGNYTRVRRALMQKVAGLPPRHHRQQAPDGNIAGGKAYENGPDGGTRGGRTGKPAPPKNDSRTLPRPPPSLSSPTLPGKGDLNAAAAATAGGAGATGGGGQGHNSPQGLARKLSRRFQAKRGTSAKVRGATAHRDSDESRGDDCDGACSVSSGNGNDRERHDGTNVLSRMASRFTTVASSFDPRNLIKNPTLRHSFWGDEEHDSGKVDEDGSGEAEEVPLTPKVELRMYSFGAPRAGNSIFAARCDEVVPDSFRVVVDGDPVPGIPTWRYAHAGTQALIDGRGRGSLIIDPSFVEKRFFARSKRHVLSHLVQAYQAGLRGNLLQAVPPELQDSVPAHWPYGIKDNSSSDSSSDGGANDNGGTSAKERKQDVEDVGGEANANTDSEGKGALPPSSMLVRQEIMAQQAVKALKRADRLNRGQSFRLVARSVSSLSFIPTTSTSATGAGEQGGGGGEANL